MVTSFEKGSLVWIEFGPTVGHEQDGHRPALVLSMQEYNRLGLCWVVPITTKRKGYPFEVALPKGLPVSGFILADQINCLDWKTRNISVVGNVSLETLIEVVGKQAAIAGWF